VAGEFGTQVSHLNPVLSDCDVLTRCRLVQGLEDGRKVSQLEDGRERTAPVADISTFDQNRLFNQGVSL
jgi:hypothetical protein